MEELDILLPRHTLEEALGPELARQYRIKRGEKHLYMPVSDGSRYLCSCGCVNALGEPCKACGAEPELLDRAVLETLSRQAEERLRQEEEEAARQEQLRLEAERQKKRKKRLKTCLAAVAGLAALALCAVGFWWVTRKAIPWSHYQKAQKALASGDYQLAHREFTLAGDYGDAATYLERFATPLLFSRVTRENARTEMVYTYDAQGRQLKSEERSFARDADGNWQDTQEPVVYIQLYDEKGNCLVSHDWYGHRVCVYNEQGDVVSEEHHIRDGQHKSSTSFVYTYDPQGRKTEVKESCTEHLSGSFSYERTVRYTYDDRDRVICRETEDRYPALQQSSTRTVTTWKFNERGDVVEWEETIEGIYDNSNNSVHKTTCHYDGEGRLLEERSLWEYETDRELNRVNTTTNTYDRKGRLISSVSANEFPTNPFRNNTTVSTREYDWEGKLVREWSQVTYSGETMQRDGGYTQTISYTHDLLGRMTEKEVVWEWTQETSIQKETYTYGSDGLMETATIENQTGNFCNRSVLFYNDNGLVEKEEFLPEKPGVESRTVEYTYAYFYYPEGKEKPQELDLDIIYSYPLLVD